MFNFDANTVEPQQSFQPLPAGNYNAQVIKAEMRDLKSGNGRALVLQIQVVDGQYVNRQVFAHLNVQHSNPDAQRIAQQQLSALCHATGALKINEQTLHLLCNKPIRVRVKIRKNEQYGDSNDVTGFEAMAGAAALPPQAAASTAPANTYAQAKAGVAVPPWAAQGV